MSIVRAALLAKIDGGSSRTVSLGAIQPVDATLLSTDPDEPEYQGFNYSWSCRIGRPTDSDPPGRKSVSCI